MEVFDADWGGGETEGGEKRGGGGGEERWRLNSPSFEIGRRVGGGGRRVGGGRCKGGGRRVKSSSFTGVSGGMRLPSPSISIVEAENVSRSIAKLFRRRRREGDGREKGGGGMEEDVEVDWKRN